MRQSLRTNVWLTMISLNASLLYAISREIICMYIICVEICTWSNGLFRWLLRLLLRWLHYCTQSLFAVRHTHRCCHCHRYHRIWYIAYVDVVSRAKVKGREKYNHQLRLMSSGQHQILESCVSQDVSIQYSNFIYSFCSHNSCTWHL